MTEDVLYSILSSNCPKKMRSMKYFDGGRIHKIFTRGGIQTVLYLINTIDLFLEMNNNNNYISLQ